LGLFSTFRGQKERYRTQLGSNSFITDILAQLGIRAKGHKIIERGQTLQIREEVQSYTPLLGGEKGNTAPDTIARKQVKRCKGQISARNTDDGLTFEISLP
jgi:hypothetical protein